MLVHGYVPPLLVYMVLEMKQEVFLGKYPSNWATSKAWFLYVHGKTQIHNKYLSVAQTQKMHNCMFGVILLLKQKVLPLQPQYWPANTALISSVCKGKERLYCTPFRSFCPSVCLDLTLKCVTPHWLVTPTESDPSRLPASLCSTFFFSCKLKVIEMCGCKLSLSV